MNQVTLKLRVTPEELDKLEEKSADTSVKSVYNNKLSARQEQILKFMEANKENC